MWILLLIRAADLQLIPNARLKNLQSRQFHSIINLQSRRGAILDDQGRDLALSTTSFSLYADPKIIESKKNVARKIAKILGLGVENLYSKIKDKDRRFVWIERFMDERKATEIKVLGIKGLSFVEEWKRVYPNDSMLAHTLGFVGLEGQGLEGLELEKDQLLQGNKKKISVRKDARGRPLSADGLLFAENPEGSDIKLTINSELQYQLETELHRAVREFDAASAVGVILDAKTSAVRAVSVFPTYDPNRAFKYAPEIRRHRAITDAFEPGSTMKAFVLAKGLKEKKIKPNSKYFCENGSFRIGNRTVKDADDKHKFGWLTVTEILAHSSNIGMTKVAFDMGEEKVREGYSEFGFGQKLGVDLPGEARGSVQPLPWSEHLLANVSFGQGITATPLQIANGYAALVNGGFLNKPYVIEEVKDAESGVVTAYKPEMIRQVLSSEESETMRLLLMAATGEDSTGENARVPGFLVGGKTGTAQKVNPVSRGYMKGAYISSFAGFIPVHDPKFVIYIAIDQPKKAYYGSQVAAPIFSRLASFAVRREGLAPQVLSQNLLQDEKQAEKLNSKKKFPASSSKLIANDVVASAEPLQRVPDLKELTIREVLRAVSGQELKVRVLGSGRVVQTVPASGEPIGDDKAITVILK